MRWKKLIRSKLSKFESLGKVSIRYENSPWNRKLEIENRLNIVKSMVFDKNVSH